MNARQMYAALWWHFVARYAVVTEITCTDEDARAEWVAAGQLPLGMPAEEYARRTADLSTTERRCDVLLYRPDDRIAVEVKVTRADLLADVADPRKQAAWRAITHRHAYAVPEGLRDVARQVVPPTSGIIVVAEAPDTGRGPWPPSGRVVWDRKIKRAPGWDPGPLPERVVRTVMIRLSRAEAHMKGHGNSESKADDVEVLRARVQRLQADLDNALNATDRAHRRAEAWRRRFAAVKDVPCGTCGHPVVPDHSRAGRSLAWNGGDAWTHRDPAHDQPCEATRRVDVGGWRPIAPAPARLSDEGAGVDAAS